jgi:DNA polymerase type B, organellar and viral
VAEKLPIEITGTIDIEAANWTRFALGVAYDGAVARHWWGHERDLADGPDALDVGDLPESLASHPPAPGSRSGEPGGLDSLVDYVRSRRGVWWAHNGGRYDLMAILERCRVRGIPCQIDRSQSRVTRVVMGNVEIRDSFALWPVALDEICGALRRPVPALPWACTCSKKCGGYCRIGERARAGDPDLLDYCTADCVSLYDGLHKLRSFAGKHKIRLRGTLGQTAWIHAKENLGVPDSTIPWDVYRAVRRADKGGRQCVARPRVARELAVAYDICNAYPAQLSHLELPVGYLNQYAADQADKCLSRARPGIYSITVRVPDDLYLPPLPWSHGGQLYFPTGTISGSWCLPELAAAFERGCAIEKVHSALVWETSAPIFSELVADWYRIRKAAGRKTPLGQWVGRLAKAFCGKLAERPERQKAAMHPESIKVCLRVGQCRNGCSGRCGRYEQLDLDGKIWGVPYQKLGGSCYPQWSAYLRASTRVQWLTQAERYDKDLVMGNTDSIWVTSRHLPAPAGDDLGQWEYQECATDLDIRSATVYAGRKMPDELRFSPDYSGVIPQGAYESVRGEFFVRGMPGATEIDWHRGAGLLDRGVLTFSRAARTRGGLWQKRVRRWTLPGGPDGELRAYYGDRKLGDDGRTYPLPAEEIRELVRVARERRQRWNEIVEPTRKQRRRRA